MPWSGRKQCSYPPLDQCNCSFEETLLSFLLLKIVFTLPMCVLQDGLVSASWADQPSAKYHIHLFLRKSPVSPFSTEDKLITGSCVCVYNTNQDPPVLQVLYFVLRMNWLLRLPGESTVHRALPSLSQELSFSFLCSSSSPLSTLSSSVSWRWIDCSTAP